MKIVFLSYYSGRVSRGVEVFVSELSARFAHNNKIRVLSGHFPESSAEINKYSPGWRFYLDKRSLEIKKFTQESLAKIDSDTDILIPTNGGWQSLLSRIWTIKHHKYVIISGQSGQGWDDRFNLLTHPDIFVALTNHQKNWAMKWGWGTRIETIPNGVDLKAFRENISPVKINLPRPVFLSVAALETDKRAHLVIEAVARLSKGSLLILGAGPQKDQLLKLGRDKLPGRFQLLSVGHDKIPGYYRGADVFTMVPVMSESFGIVYLEAMAANLPIVAPDDPIRREIIDQAGLFVNPEKIDEYSRALEKAAGAGWGDLPRQRAEKFSWDKIAKEYENLFRSLLDK